MKTVVLNNDYGGYGLSDILVREYLTRKEIPFQEQESGNEYLQNAFFIIEDGEEKRYYGNWSINREDPLLAELVRQLGEGANGPSAELAVKELEDGIHYRIDEYDGWESLECYVPVTLDELSKGLSEEQMRLVKICGRVELRD